MGSGQELLERLIFGGLGIVFPVHIGKAPEYRFISQFLSHFQIFLAVDALGRAVEFWHFRTHGVPVEVFQIG